MNAIEKAIQVVGGQAKLATSLRVSPQAVNQWVTGKRDVPITQCAEIERLTGGAVTARELRPDVAAIFSPKAGAQ